MPSCIVLDSYFEGLQGEPIPMALANLLLSEELSSFMTSSWISFEFVSENMPLSFYLLYKSQYGQY